MSKEKKEEVEKHQNEGAANYVANGPHITFTKADGAIAIDEPELQEKDPEFPGLTKHELLQYVNDPYWVRVRWIILVAFWVVWFAMLITAIVLIVLAPRCPETPDVKWWEHSVVYKIHPKSFQDSDGDGMGDLPGVTSRLSYLEELKVKAVGFSAIYQTGSASDVIDYKTIDRSLGTMDEFKEFVKKLHKKGMNLILDFIPNMTSRNHHWFQQSQLGGSGNSTNYTDYYIWQQGAAGGNSNPPNGWLTKDGESAWMFDEQRGEFYLFHENENQPMLNLKSEFVQAELIDVAKFWLDNGADGFRVVNADQPVDNSKDPKSWGSPFQPEIYEFLAELRKLVDSHYDNPEDYRITPFNKPARFLIIDALGSLNQSGPLVTHDNQTGVHMVTNPSLLSIDKQCGTECVAKSVSDYISGLPNGFKANWKLTDEQSHKFASRITEGTTKVATMLLLMLPGSPSVLYGDEIAMRDGTSFNQEKNLTKDDPIMPMQWSNEYNAGFTTNVRPFKEVNPTYIIKNVKAGTAHGAGTTDLEVFMELSELRNEPSFVWGKFERVQLPTADIFAYVRQAEGFTGYLVAMNFPAKDTTVANSYADFHQAMPQLIPSEAEIVMTTGNFPEKRWSQYNIGMKASMEQFILHAGEGVIFALPWKHQVFSL